MISIYPKLISKKSALASPCSGLKSPIPNRYNIGQLLIRVVIKLFKSKSKIITFKLCKDSINRRREDE